MHHLAAVTTGIYMGFRGPSIISARTRLQGFFVWEVLDFVLNASLFVLVGLQLRGVVTNLDGHSARTLAGYAVAVSGVVIGTRLIWVLHRSLPDPAAGPTTKPAGAAGRRRAAPRDRNVIIFLTFSVIFATLVLQGLTLPVLIQRLRIERGVYNYRKRRFAARAGTGRVAQ
jgi:NhaP-type Na+/H+ or K+/H+ antiporter